MRVSVRWFVFQNIMTFNKCSINGVSYGDLLDKRGKPMDITDVSRLTAFYFVNYILLDICVCCVYANKLSSYSNQPYTIKKTIIFYYFFTLMITVIHYSVTWSQRKLLNLIFSSCFLFNKIDLNFCRKRRRLISRKIHITRRHSISMILVCWSSPSRPMKRCLCFSDFLPCATLLCQQRKMVMFINFLILIFLGCYRENKYIFLFSRIT